MLRNGERESHSYVAGIYSDRKIAEYEARFHMIMRAGKYSAEIIEEVIDDPSGRGLVHYIGDCTDTKEELEIAIQSRRDWIKYRAELIKEFNAK